MKTKIIDLLSRHQILVSSGLIGIVLVGGASFYYRNNLHLTASVTSASCFLQPEIDAKVAVKADLTSQASTTALDIKANNDAITENYKLLTQTNALIASTSAQIVSDYALSAQKTGVDTLFGQLNDKQALDSLYAQVQTAKALASAPTASLTVNNSHDATLNIGDKLSYVWNATNANKYSSSYTATGGSACGVGGSWIANTASGAYPPTVISSSLAGCSYIVRYIATNSSGQSAQDSVTVKINKAAAPASPVASLTVNGVHDLTLNVGDKISYAWNAINADKFTSTYTANGAPACTGSGAWIANTGSGSYPPSAIPASIAGCSYTLTYTVSSSKTGANASDTVKVKVANVAPTATLTENGAHNLAVNVGDKVTFAWNTAYADKATSSYTANTAACGAGGAWIASTLSGTGIYVAPAAQMGCSYVINYVATQSSTGQTAKDTIALSINKKTASASNVFGLASAAAALGGTTSDYNTLLAQYNSALATYNSKYNSSAATASDLTSKYNTLLTAYNALVQKNNDTKAKIASLNTDKATYTANDQTLNAKATDLDAKQKTLSQQIVDANLEISTDQANLCPKTETDGGPGSLAANLSACSDGIDNDRNGLQDCEDSACATAVVCQTNNNTNTNNTGTNGNGNGTNQTIDCAKDDADLQSKKADLQQQIQDNQNQIDDLEADIKVQEYNIARFDDDNAKAKKSEDENGRAARELAISNLTQAMRSLQLCPAEICDNSIDDNHDGFTDCADSSCSNASNCKQQVDCSDTSNCGNSECSGSSACQKQNQNTCDKSACNSKNQQQKCKENGQDVTLICCPSAEKVLDDAGNWTGAYKDGPMPYGWQTFDPGVGECAYDVPDSP
jgi:hypothetical protein